MSLDLPVTVFTDKFGHKISELETSLTKVKQEFSNK